MIQLNSKKINQLETIAQVILGVVLLGCLFLDVYKSSLLAYLIGAVLIHQGARSLKAKYDPDGLAVEDEEEKKDELSEMIDWYLEIAPEKKRKSGYVPKDGDGDCVPSGRAAGEHRRTGCFGEILRRR